MFEFILMLFIIFIIWSLDKKPPQYPPGPWGLPLIGYIPFGLKHFDEKFKVLYKKHHPLFSWRIGSQLLVFITDYKLVKEAFQSPDFVDRPNVSFISIFERETEMGVISTNGVHWQNTRRFIHTHLRDLGMGTSKIVSAVQREANELVKIMEKQAGTPAPVPEEISTAIINILWQMVIGKRYDLHNVEIMNLDKDIHNLQNNLELIALEDFFPWLRSILPESVMNFITKKPIHRNLSNNIKQHFEKDIEYHIATLVENNPRDFIDEYLIEMEKRKGDPESTMSRKDLLGCIGDLFVAGLETTLISLHWSIFYLAKYPEIQKELQNEIDNGLSNGISPSLEDKARLPKVEAFIVEILRYSSIAKFGVPRAAVGDTKFAGYVIPKGAIVMASQNIIHFDESFFSSAESFNPNRFIDSNGNFNSPKEGFIPFGMGKRKCLGESLARMELFIFLVTMLQQLEFHVPPNKDISLNPLPILALNMPHLYQDILIKKRSLTT